MNQLSSEEGERNGLRCMTGFSVAVLISDTATLESDSMVKTGGARRDVRRKGAGTRLDPAPGVATALLKNVVSFPVCAVTMASRCVLLFTWISQLPSPPVPVLMSFWHFSQNRVASAVGLRRIRSVTHNFVV